jgi:hypothetical protein
MEPLPNIMIRSDGSRYFQGPTPLPFCPTCSEDLDYLDTIYLRGSNKSYTLYICHNEECEDENSIFNDWGDRLSRGDPSGLY